MTALNKINDKEKSMKRSKATEQIVLNIFFIMFCTLIILPFLMVVSVSLSSEQDIIDFGYKLIPRKIDLSAYKFVFGNASAIINAYEVTIFYSVTGTAMSVLTMAGVAYALTKPDLPGKRAVSFYIFFTMLFGGGLVPTYILLTNYLHLSNTVWVYIFPSLVSPWYVFMIRTFFTALPYELSESATIDGANEYMIFFKVILPLSKSVMATVALLTFLGKWNDWFTAMMYIDDEKLFSLQYLLQKIMNNIKMIQEQTAQGLGNMIKTQDIPSESARMAMAIVAAGPALVIFPFFQKYFVRGMTVGAVKG